MEVAINKTLSLCPQYPTANSTIPRIYNATIFNDPDQLAQVACEAARLKSLTRPFLSASLKVYGAEGILGTISTVLALLAYSLKGFDATAFCYFRAINVFDFPYLVYNICLGFNLRINNAIGQAAFSFSSQVAGKTARLLVLWTSIDRAIACYSPLKYKCLDNRMVALGIISGVLGLSLFHNLFMSYFDWRLNFVGIPQPAEMLRCYYQVWRAFELITMLISLPFVIRGFILISKRKKKLLSGGDGTNRELLKQIKTNRFLCILQLCEGIPFILVILIDYLSYLTNFLSYTRDTVPYLVGGTYNENVHQQTLVLAQMIFQHYLLPLADLYGHGCHFYIYMAFSPKFRNTVITFIKGRLNRASVSSMG